MKLLKREKGANTPIETTEVEVGDMTLGELKDTVLSLAELVKTYQKELDNHLLVPKDESTILEINGRLLRGKVAHVFDDKGENLKTRKVVDGELKTDMKRGIL